MTLCSQMQMREPRITIMHIMLTSSACMIETFGTEKQQKTQRIVECNRNLLNIYLSISQSNKQIISESIKLSICLSI